MEIFESGHTTGQAARSNPKVHDGAANLRVRASNLQGGEEKERGGAQGERVAVGGKDVNM